MTGFAGKHEPGRHPIFNLKARPGVMAFAALGMIAAIDPRGFRYDQGNGEQNDPDGG
jgi:hypothetical protein